MALIHNNTKNIVVDIGSTKSKLASNILINYLKVKNIDKIDLLIITHFHEDHMNGFFDVINSIEIEKIAYSIPKEEVDIFDEFYKIAKDKKISLIEVAKYDEISFNNINIKILMPEDNINIDTNDTLNANSLVVDIYIQNMNNKNYLFMGDSTKITEEYLVKKTNILNKNIDVLQVGHHGSKTSTSEHFLNFFNIKNAVISAKKEKFGHPDKETIEKLKKFKINIFITENNGMIRFN